MMKHLVYNRHKSVCRLLATSRTLCAKASPSMSLSAETIDNNDSAKLIFSAASAVAHRKDRHREKGTRVSYSFQYLESVQLTPKFRGSEIVELENFRAATVEDIASIHSGFYISSIQMASKQASKQGVLYIEASGPTYVTGTTFADSLVAVGAGLSLVDSVVAASKINHNPPVGFALIRPPGHHALPDRAMGFCIFGNVAIAARYAQRVHGLKRIFIIDFDAHHGNGTNDIFYDDPDIFFLSTHQDGVYPGTGKFDDIGCGNGEGATLNLPLPEGSGDISMRTVFNEVIVPAAQRFKPDIILVSAGFDGHILDPVAGFQFSSGTYHMLASNIRQLAKDLCGGRCVFFLEGGYNLVGLSNSISESFRALVGEPSVAPKLDELYSRYFEDEPSSKVKEAIQRIKHLHSL